MSCWEELVDMWESAEWKEKHAKGKAKRVFIKGATHHQGSASLKGFAVRYVSVLPHSSYLCVGIDPLY